MGTIDIDAVIKGNLTGSDVVNNYEFLVCYKSNSKLCLFGKNALRNSNWNDAYYANWTVSFPNSEPIVGGITITNVSTPTYEQIMSKCANWKGDRANFWMNNSPASGFVMYMQQGVGTAYVIFYTNATSNSFGIYPFVEIDL